MMAELLQTVNNPEITLYGVGSVEEEVGLRGAQTSAEHIKPDVVIVLDTAVARLLSLLSAFEVVVWMTDGWPLYESRLKGKLHVISKRYTQRIERHNLNLRQHLARLGRKSLSFSKSVELHDKVIGHYLNIKHYQ
nr:IS1 family transposase [Shigella flexneri]